MAGKLIRFDLGRACGDCEFYDVVVSQHRLDFCAVVSGFRVAGIPEPSYEEYCRIVPPPGRPHSLCPEGGGRVIRFRQSK